MENQRPSQAVECDPSVMAWAGPSGSTLQCPIYGFVSKHDSYVRRIMDRIPGPGSAQSHSCFKRAIVGCRKISLYYSSTYFFYGHTYLHKGSTYLGPNRIQLCPVTTIKKGLCLLLLAENR